MEVNNTENTKKLSRQQWKNKMKNKRKCKNKYHQNKPEEQVHEMGSVDKREEEEEEEEVKTDSYSNNNSDKITQTAGQKKKKDNEYKPQKKAITKEDTDTLREEKQQIEKEKKTKSSQVKKSVTKSSADGSKRQAGEPEVEITDDQPQVKRLKPELSKEQSQKRDKLRKMLRNQKADQQESPVKQKDKPAAPEEEVKQDRSASLRFRMEQRLESARFRYINEVLYSTSSSEARRMFKQDPQAFWIYHRGYMAQVQKWPANPVDAIIAYIRQKWDKFVNIVHIFLMRTHTHPHITQERNLGLVITSTTPIEQFEIKVYCTASQKKELIAFQLSHNSGRIFFIISASSAHVT